MRRSITCLVPLVAVLLSTVLAGPALAAVTVSRAEVDGDRLRLEGTAAASRDITVDGVVLGRSDAAGAVRIERDGYRPPADCTVDVGDGSGALTPATLSGCTASTPPPPSPPPSTDTTAPSVPTELRATVVGSTVSLSWSPSTDDTAVTGYRVSRDGAALATTDDTTHLDQGVAAGPHTYTVAAFDAAGNRSGESAPAAVEVAAAEGLTFLTPARLPDATVGQAYLASIVCSDPPGPSSFRFKVVSGRVPEGLRFTGNTLPTRPEARVTGTPEASGTTSFTVEVTDGTGASARRTFTLVVVPG